MGAHSLSVDAFRDRQGRIDAVVNALIAAGITHATTPVEGRVALVRSWGDLGPSLCGALLGMAVVMPLILGLIVFSVSLALRLRGRAGPALATAPRRWPLRALGLAAGHSLRLGALGLALWVAARSWAPDLEVSRSFLLGTMTAATGLAAWWVSRRTTLAAFALRD
jgi:hypothetical protein